MEEVKIKIFFTYIDWTLEIPPRPFYVGKGQLGRVNQRERNDRWKIIANEYGWNREVIFATKDEAYAFEQEILGILELGTFENGKPGRWGANKTVGGEGTGGWRHTEEWKRQAHLRCVGSNNPMFGVRGKENPKFLKKLSDESKKRYDVDLTIHVPY